MFALFEAGNQVIRLNTNPRHRLRRRLGLTMWHLSEVRLPLRQYHIATRPRRKRVTAETETRHGRGGNATHTRRDDISLLQLPYNFLPANDIYSMRQCFEACTHISSIKRIDSRIIPWQGKQCIFDSCRAVFLLRCDHDIIEEETLGRSELNAATPRANNTQGIRSPRSAFHHK